MAAKGFAHTHNKRKLW